MDADDPRRRAEAAEAQAGYRVEPGALSDYALLLNELSSKISPDSYVAKHAQIEPFNHGFLHILMPLHDRVVNVVTRQVKGIFGPR